MRSVTRQKGGKNAPRACFANHRSTREDIDFMVKEVIKLGDEIVAT